MDYRIRIVEVLSSIWDWFTIGVAGAVLVVLTALAVVIPPLMGYYFGIKAEVDSGYLVAAATMIGLIIGCIAGAVAYGLTRTPVGLVMIIVTNVVVFCAAIGQAFDGKITSDDLINVHLMCAGSILTSILAFCGRKAYYDRYGEDNWLIADNY